MAWGLEQDAGSYVVLDDVAYGRTGPWAVNLWMRTANSSGTALQYLYSHNSSASNGDVNSLAWGPNQVGGLRVNGDNAWAIWLTTFGYRT